MQGMPAAAYVEIHASSTCCKAFDFDFVSVSRKAMDSSARPSRMCSSSAGPYFPPLVRRRKHSVGQAFSKSYRPPKVKKKKNNRSRPKVLSVCVQPRRVVVQLFFFTCRWGGDSVRAKAHHSVRSMSLGKTLRILGYASVLQGTNEVGNGIRTHLKNENIK